MARIAFTQDGTPVESGVTDSGGSDYSPSPESSSPTYGNGTYGSAPYNPVSGGGYNDGTYGRSPYYNPTNPYPSYNNGTIGRAPFGGYPQSAYYPSTYTPGFNYAQAYTNYANGVPPGGSDQSPTSNDPRSILHMLLSQGMDPNSAVNQVNQQFGMQTGSSLAYYAPGSHGPGSGAVVGLPPQMGGGYLAQGPDGQWGWNAGDSGGVFNDPATQAFEQLLNQRIGQLQTPFDYTELTNAINQLKAYNQTLQGPAYTPAQMDLFQTQQIDPLTSQRDAMDQQIIQHFAAQGMGPSSGPVQQAIQANHLNYQKLSAQARAGIASNAVGAQKQQEAQAASLAPLIAQLSQVPFNQQQGRLDQALNLASIIPNMAWSRLMGASNAIQPINTASLLNSYGYLGNLGYQQGAGYASSLSQILPYILQLFQ